MFKKVLELSLGSRMKKKESESKDYCEGYYIEQKSVNID